MRLEGSEQHGSPVANGDPGAVWSAGCAIDDLFVELDLAAAPAPVDGVAWWTVAWRTAEGAVSCLVRDLRAMPTAVMQPVRRFAWSTRQRHRPGLQFMVSTGRHHGFESLAEQRLLLGLDFAGDVLQVLGQPFRLRYTTAGKARDHVPDILAVTGQGVWLFDVRPADRVRAAACLGSPPRGRPGPRRAGPGRSC